MATFLKRREVGDGAKAKVQGVSVAESDPAFAKAYPALAEFLSLEEWEPGVERQRGTITIFYEEGVFRASVNDRDAEAVAFVTKKCFKTLLESIEKGLTGDSLDWRKSWHKGKGKGKKG